MQGTCTVVPVGLCPGLIQAFIQLAEEQLCMLHLTRFWHSGALPLFRAIRFIHTRRGRLTH